MGGGGELTCILYKTKHYASVCKKERESVCVFEGVRFNQQEFKWSGNGSHSKKYDFAKAHKNFPHTTKFFYDTQRAMSHTVGKIPDGFWRVSM